MDSLAGIFLGVLAASLLIAVLKDGPGAATTWFKAKFLGEATGHI